MVESIPYTDSGNRSIVKLNHRSFLDDPHLLRLFTEYRATGNFTGHLAELSPEDAVVVGDIKASVLALRKMQAERQYSPGRMWSNLNDSMAANIINAAPRLFNHIGAISYKTFAPQWLSLEAVIVEVLRTLIAYDYLSSNVKTFDGLFTNLNSPYFTIDGHKLNTGIRAIEEKLIIQPILDEIKLRQNTVRILEIGAGSAQLAHLLLREQAKVVVIDLPGMHARGPYFLYKTSGVRVCTYEKYLALGSNLAEALREYDVVYLPPWEKDAIDMRFDLAINIHSLSEMDLSEAILYLELIRSTCDYFFSVNTNTRGLDRRQQPEYPEHNSCSYGEYLRMNVIRTGATLYDTALQKTPHYVYAIYKRA